MDSLPGRAGPVSYIVRPQEGAPIPELSEPWDALDVLEEYEGEPDFEPRWRGFLRDCSLLLLPGLPPEASDWVATADEFDAGRLSADGLTGARVGAWQFHDARRDTSPATELSGLRAVMYRLWPPGANRWHESAWHFLHFLKATGVREEHWWPLLRARFVGILDRSREAEPGAAPDPAT